ncbi:YidH family protein [Desulfosporosinus sp. SYSU MS00001]|uniref:YidH family protein n=1 Tax=Desulfosporosinus sp. SYSU MS00001 TaxID=3416284 RepID=UPI003CF49389
MLTKEISSQKPNTNRRLHLANERTFLAWIRTSIAMMGFGFVVERFALFLKQMSYVLGQSNLDVTFPPSHGYSTMIGISLVALGSLMSVLAYLKYRNVDLQIDTNTYQPSSFLNILLSISVLAVGMFLIFYLLQSI